MGQTGVCANRLHYPCRSAVTDTDKRFLLNLQFFLYMATKNPVPGRLVFQARGPVRVALYALLGAERSCVLMVASAATDGDERSLIVKSEGLLAA